MKKQTKSSKAKSKKVAAAKQIIVVHNGRQRFWGVVALAGLFACGLMVGLSIKTTPIQQTQNDTNVPEQVEENVVSEPQDVCSEVERLLIRRLPDATDDADDRKRGAFLKEVAYDRDQRIRQYANDRLYIWRICGRSCLLRCGRRIGRGGR